MPATTMSSRAFNQDTSGAKKTASEGPVIITDRGRPAHVLMTYEAYRKLSGSGLTLGEALYMPGIADIELELPSRKELIARDIDFS